MNFATVRATVEYDPAQTDVAALQAAVRSAGYDALVPPRTTTGHAVRTDDLHDAEAQARHDEYQRQSRRFWVAAALTVPVAILAMGSHIVPQFTPLLNQPWRPWVELR